MIKPRLKNIHCPCRDNPIPQLVPLLTNPASKFEFPHVQTISLLEQFKTVDRSVDRRWQLFINQSIRVVVATIYQSVDPWLQLCINHSIGGGTYSSISRSVVATIYQSVDHWWQLFINQSIRDCNYLSVNRSLVATICINHSIKDDKHYQSFDRWWQLFNNQYISGWNYYQSVCHFLELFINQ